MGSTRYGCFLGLTKIGLGAPEYCLRVVLQNVGAYSLLGLPIALIR